MKNILYTAVATALIAVSSFSPLEQSIYAAEDTKQTAALSPKVGNKLLELQELANAQPPQCGAAISQAQGMLGWKNLSGYEKVQIYNFMGFCYYKTDNINGATNAYENVLAQGSDVPLGVQQSILQTLASLYLSQENYSKGLDAVNRLMAIVPNPTADLWVLKGQAHYQAGQYGQVIKPIDRAIQMFKSQGRNPKENWLLMSRHAAYEQGDFKAMSNFIRELIRYYPKDSYISQLAGAYSQSGDNKRFLVLTEILYEGGYKTDASTIKNLSQLFLMEEAPYKAAKLLDKEMKAGRIPNNLDNKKLLASSWFQARDDNKAIPVLKSAAEQSRDPELYIRLGQSLMNIGKWQDAVSALDSAIANGVKNRQATYTMLGLSYLELDNLAKAKTSFSQAGGRQSRTYINYIEKELERVAQLKKDQNVEAIKTRKDAILDNTEVE